MTKKTTPQEFLAKARAIHGERYSYAQTRYESNKKKVIIECSTHGSFEQSPTDHLAGKGCKSCGRKSSGKVRTLPDSDFLSRAAQKHGERYDYSQAKYLGYSKKVTILCSEHGPFEQTPAKHLAGAGCPACALQAQSHQQTLTQKEFLQRCQEAHGDRYDYSQATYARSDQKLEIICRAHGAFQQTPITHWQGQGCRQCFNAKNSTRMTHSQEEFIALAKNIHTGYDYSQVEYAGSKAPVQLTCPNGHSFLQRPNDHLSGHGCSVCLGVGISQPEAEIKTLLESWGLSVKENCRKALGSGLEVDLLVNHLAIEYNGLYWHSEPRRDRLYHRNKTRQAAAAGLQMIHIFEDEWLEKREIILARLRAKLGLGAKRHARKLDLWPVGWAQASQFYNAHHLQGAGTAGKSFGLFEGNTLIACASFGRRAGEMEVLRYASIDTVVGGFGKLFQAFLRERPEVSSVISYADLRWGTGLVYASQGFMLESNTAPGYFWVKKLKRYPRQMFQKHKLAKLLPNFNPTASETENMRANGFSRIFDCGHAKWRWTRPT